MSKLSDLKAKAAERRPRAQVETLHRGHATDAVRNAMPPPVVTLYCLIGSGSIVGLMYFAGDLHGGEGGGARWAMAAIGVMTALSLAVLGWRHHRAGRLERGAGSLEDAVKRSAAGGDPGGGAEEAARMDDLREEFRRGIDIFTRHGKSFYSYPWYVLAGEPGSGKSEAVRRSELKFPEQLQNRMQGVGGTVSMHWWFTSQAIIIDTAGAMLTRPEAAQRFREFLNLLKTHRPDCPINGMVLTIPVDSLQVDDAGAIERKAAGIAAQLAIVQQTLDVRFPVYLMISKSDLLPGWREFFDAPGQAKYERQMMGWANPDPLDTPFDPARVSEAIEEIAGRLRMRSLALLSDPTPRQQDGRRTDEVDALYTFPGHLSGLIPGLIKYLEIIFDTGDWSSKPPFFRGVFFTSALQEGAQLDTELARMLDIPVENLPSEGVYVREKAVFLRDFFLEKIFPEQGLVTRLTNVSGYLRKKLMTFYGITLALMLLLAGWALLIKFSLQKQMAAEDAYWAAVNSNWSNGALMPVVDVSQDGGKSRGFLNKPVSLRGNDGKPAPRTQLLTELLDRTSRPLRFSMVFQPVRVWRDYENRRREAALAACESGLFKPLVDAARARMIRDAASPDSLDRMAKNRMFRAFGQLARLESWIAGAGKAPAKADWQEFFTHLIAYVGAEWTALGLGAGGVPAGAEPGSGGASDEEQKETAAQGKSRMEADRLAVEQMSALAAGLPSPDEGGSFVKGRTWLSEENPSNTKGALASVLPLLQTSQGKLKTARDQVADTLRNLKEREESWQDSFKKLQRADLSPDEADAVLTQLDKCVPDADPGPDTRQLPDGSVLDQALRDANSVISAENQPDPPPPGLSILISWKSDIRAMYQERTSNPASSQEEQKKWERRKLDLQDFRKAIEAKKPDLSKLRIGRLGMVLDEARKQAAATVNPEDWVSEGASAEVKKICGNLQKHQGRRVEEIVLVNYMSMLRESLRENIRWPLVSDPAKPYTEANFLESHLKEYFENIEKDRLASESLMDAERLTALFSACSRSHNIFRALTNDPRIIFPDPAADENIPEPAVDSAGQPLPGDASAVPRFQKLTFYHPTSPRTMVRKGSVPWRIFSSVGYHATFDQQGGLKKEVAGMVFNPLDTLITSSGAGLAFPLTIRNGAGGPPLEIEAVTVETRPRLPVGKWPTRKEFNLPSQ